MSLLSSSSSIQIVEIEPHTDGDPTHLPKPHWELDNPPKRYLKLLGQLWMEHRGEAKPGKLYLLNKLPDGYRLYWRPRPTNAKIIDKHLYGHPSHKFFDSPNRFWPHFRHLMENGNNFDCPCTVCRAGTGAPLPLGASASKMTSRPVGRPKGYAVTPAGPVDEEGSPDPYRRLIDNLRRDGIVDKNIVESSSLDWRSERKLLPSLLQRVASQYAWMPRVGELVLFVRTLVGDICYDGETQTYKDFDEKSETFVGWPQWEAGVIGQAADETLGLQDLCLEDTRRQNVTISGFRVEPYPDPNQQRKALSKQYKYVPLHYIRPFAFYKEYLSGLEHDAWHGTIRNALTVTSSISLLEKYRFAGTWPTAAIYCKGVFIGSELLCVGDIARLRPRQDHRTPQDILRITHINLHFSNLDKASDSDTDSGHPYNSTILVTGKAFTLDKGRAHDPTPVSHGFTNATLPKDFEGYGQWFWLHEPSKHLQVSFPRIIGRCFEPNSMTAWFPHLADEHGNPQRPSLGTGYDGLQMARAYSSAHDQRIKDGKTWFWGDTRAQTLDLETLNGVELSAHDLDRNPAKWRKMIKIMDGVAGSEEKASVRQTLAERGLRQQSRLANSMGTMLVTEGESDELGMSSEGGRLAGRKRMRGEDDSSDDDAEGSTADESRRQRLLDDSSSPADTDTDELVEGEEVSALDSFRLAAARDPSSQPRVVIEID